jgi:hypothetical protein
VDLDIEVPGFGFVRCCLLRYYNPIRKHLRVFTYVGPNMYSR